MYLWNAGSGSIEELCELPNDGDYISSLNWAADGSHLSVGTSGSKVQIWDVTRMKQVGASVARQFGRRNTIHHSIKTNMLSCKNAILVA